MLAIPEAVAQRWASGTDRYCHLLELGFDTTLRFTDAGHDVLWLGNRYSATGYVLGIETPTSEAELRVGEFNLELSLVDGNFAAIAFGSSSIINRPFALYRCHLGDSGEPDFVHILFDGLFTGASADTDPDKPVMQLSIAGPWADFERANEWATTQVSHQRRFPNDNSMKFCGRAQEVAWFNGKPGA